MTNQQNYDYNLTLYLCSTYGNNLLKETSTVYK